MNNGLKIILSPFALAYGCATYLRNRMYDWNILKEKKFEVHTIGVGNLSVGGAGKTPLVEYLIRLLRRNNFKLATLSRGYKRKTSGFVLAGEESTSHEIGDEPLIYKSKYDVDVAVDASRVNGVQQLLALGANTPQVILLDDVFQHRAIRCGLNIVVSDYNNIYYKDEMLPAGTLREFKGGIKRADVIVISKTPERTSAVEIRGIIRDINPAAHQQVFFSYLKYGELTSISDNKKTLDTLNDLFRFRVISFSGIANYVPMVSYLKEYAADVKHLPFPDHHDFTESDLREIDRYFKSFEGGNKILVTTEKDLMRLKNPGLWEHAKRMDIYILPVEVSFKDKEEEFNELILKYVRTSKFHHEKYS